jgi:ADP-ribose pyrophosphatase
MGSWKTLGTKIIYANKWLSLREDDVTMPNGEKGIYSMVELPHSFIHLIAVTNEDEFLLVEQYRYPLQQNTWEVVAGGMEDRESPEAAAKRELLEESGYTTDTFTKIGEIFADTSIIPTKGHVFIAENAKKVSNELDEVDGIIQVKAFPADTVHKMIIEGKIMCPHSISAFYLAKAYLERKDI